MNVRFAPNVSVIEFDRGNDLAPPPRAKIMISKRSSNGEKKTSVKISIPFDGDFDALENDLNSRPGLYAAVEDLEVLAPVFWNMPGMQGGQPLSNGLAAFVGRHGQRLKHITVQMGSLVAVTSLLTHIGQCCDLSVLRLTTGLDSPLEGIAAAIHQGLSELRRFPSIVISGSLFSWDLILRLGMLGIRDLIFDSPIPRAYLPPSIYTPQNAALDVPEVSPTRVLNRHQRFPQLRSLTLTPHTVDLLLDLHRILEPIPSVTSLTVVVSMLHHPLAATMIHHRLAIVFPNLEHLHFEVTHANVQEEPEWLDIRDLRKHTHLTSLSIVHPYPLLLEDQNVEFMLSESAWPMMTTLSLNPSPRFPMWPGYPPTALTWRVLTDTARGSGMLKSLGVYLGAQSSACPPPDGKFGPGVDTNRVLEQLTVGTHGYMHAESFPVLQGMFVNAKVVNSANMAR